MISSSHKFPMRSGFLRFRARARRVVTPHLTIFFAPTSDLSAVRREAKDRLELVIPSRLAVVVSKKVNKSAVTRNWLKRLVYDSLWPRLSELNVDCVVVFKSLPISKTKVNSDSVLSELNSLTFK